MPCLPLKEVRQKGTTMKTVLSLLSLVIATAPAAAAEKAFDPEAAARFLAPFLDDQTFAVARVDLGRLDVVAFLTTVGRLAKLPEKDSQRSGESIGGWVAKIKRAGGREVYVVLNLNDFPDAPFFLVPLAQDADARALAGLVTVPG